MIYIFTALYCEASMLIGQYGLAKDPECTWLQEFCSETEGIRLTVTGVGEIAAAAAVGSVCSVYRPGRGDMLLNVGACAHASEEDGIFLCNKITELATGRTFYPDMLYRHGFREQAVVTGMQPWNGGSTEPGRTGETGAVCAGSLYDMEAAAIYQAGSRFFGPHQMLFLKVVTDRGAARKVSKEQIERRMEKYRGEISAFLEQISAIARREGSGGFSLGPEEEALVRKFCADLHCSRAMENFVEQYIRYLSLSGADCFSVIRDMYGEGLLPCRDRREGKRRFEDFGKRVF